MVSVIKKATLSPGDLFELDWEAEGYLVRYRIKSENKNLSSHWSPIYILKVDDFEDVEGSFFESIGEDDKINLTVVWDDVYNRPRYDIFVAFRGVEDSESFVYDGDSFSYHGTSPTHNYSLVKPEGAESVRFIIQPAANKKIIKNKFVIYDSDEPIQTIYDEYGYDQYS